MLIITVLGEEHYDEVRKRFYTEGDFELHLEHSLVSLSKWESIHEKPYLAPGTRTTEEAYSYVECMIVNPVFPPGIIADLSSDNLEAIRTYIDAKRSATWFSDNANAPKSNEVITSELIYYWMTVFSIPFECEHWHLSRLFALIKICNLKAAKPKKMSRNELAQRNRELNAQRKKQYGTNG